MKDPFNDPFFADFNKQQNTFNARFRVAQKAALAWFLFVALLVVSMLGGLAYVAVHFLAKVW